MLRPVCYNIPEGKREQEALSDELLKALEGVFQGVTHAVGDNATLYRLDIGRVYESVKSGDLVVAGQFVDRSDGEVFDFEINQGTGKVGYKSTGDFLEGTSKNWPWRGLGPHPLQLLQWVSLVSPGGTRIFRGALKNLKEASGPNPRGDRQKYNLSAKDAAMETVASFHNLVPRRPSAARPL